MYIKILFFNTFIFFCSFCNKAETCCQLFARLFGEENLNIEGFSGTDEARLKLTFEYSKKNKITDIEYINYKYKYNKNDLSQITIFEKENEFREVKDFQINHDEDENILNLFTFTNNYIFPQDKINIEENNNNWIAIDDFKKDLKQEEQNIVKKEDPTSLKTKTEKMLNLAFIDPGEHGIYIIKIKLHDKTQGFIFIDYMVTIGESGVYFYEIKKMFFKSNNEQKFINHSRNYKIIKSNDGTHNEFGLFKFNNLN